MGQVGWLGYKRSAYTLSQQGIPNQYSCALNLYDPSRAPWPARPDISSRKQAAV